MAIQEEIAVLELLRQREAEFIKVRQCEDGVCRLLGLSVFPFAGAPELPSRQRGKRSVTLKSLRRRQVSEARGARAVQVSGMGVQLRRLVRGEDAYRIVYRHAGKTEASFQLDADVLKKLFLIVSEDFSVLSVETVSFRSLDDWTSMAVLWSSSVKDVPPSSSEGTENV